MKLSKFLSAGACLGLMIAAAPVSAKQLTISTQLKQFGGRPAYIAVYLTDPNGRLYDTLWMAGYKSKYYVHLREWMRGARQSRTRVSSVTGASVGSGRTLRVTADIADNLIAAGYQVRVDAAVEGYGEFPRAAVLTLGKQTSTSGRGIVASVSVK